MRLEKKLKMQIGSEEEGHHSHMSKDTTSDLIADLIGFHLCITIVVASH